MSAPPSLRADRTGPTPRPGRSLALALALVLALGAGSAGCSTDDPSSSASPTTSVSPATTAPAIGDAGPDGAPGGDGGVPDGPMAVVDEELTGGNGPFIGSATGLEVPEGYVQEEFVAEGSATDYVAEGSLGGDGRWTFTPGTRADYRTRVLVRRPVDPTDASGTVIVEWLNVSGGLDANPDYASTEAEIVRRGHTWVGVSAQLIGVEGGPVLVAPEGVADLVGKGLVALDGDRYGTLSHPGDGFSFDIFTQIARAARAGEAFVGGVVPDVVLAVGESQSAIALTTYYNGVQPLTAAFDGFLIHSRAYAALPLVEPGAFADLAGAMVATPEPVLLRDDVEAPALVLQAEGDVVGILGSARARQPDRATVRLWEVAGTAHADATLLGPLAATLDCGVAINDGPMHVVAKAALHHLDRWVRTGEAPPEAERLELTDTEPPGIARDPDGIALGGIRTPPVDVPVEVLSGDPGPEPGLLCILMGSTSPLPAERIVELHGTRARYEAAYDAALDEAVAAGFVLDDDREALAAFADPAAVPGG